MVLDASSEVESRAVRPLIHKLERFGPLAEPERDLLTRLAAEASLVAPRTDLAHEGEIPNCLFVFLEGMACRYKVRSSGARQILAYLVPGDFCDVDVGLLTRRDHAISTLSSCRVARIELDTLQDLLVNQPSLIRAMRRATLVDDATAREWLVNVGSRSAIERIAHLFLELLLRLRAIGLTRGDSYDLPVSQLDLAETTGLSTVHVNRTLQDLKRQGLIELRSRLLTIRNVPRLVTLSGFNPRYLSLETVGLP